MVPSTALPIGITIIIPCIMFIDDSDNGGNIVADSGCHHHHYYPALCLMPYLCGLYRATPCSVPAGLCDSLLGIFAQDLVGLLPITCAILLLLLDVQAGCLYTSASPFQHSHCDLPLTWACCIPPCTQAPRPAAIHCHFPRLGTGGLVDAALACMETLPDLEAGAVETDLGDGCLLCLGG